MQPLVKAPVRLLLPAALALSACAEQPSAPGTGAGHREPVFLDCSLGCTLVDSPRPLRAAIAKPDSGGKTLQLAQVELFGEAGQTVELLLTADDPVLAAAGPAAGLLVGIGDQVPQRFALRTLQGGVLVYRFEDDESVQMTVALEGRVENTRTGSLSLTLSTAAAVEVVMAPWGWLRPDVPPMLNLNTTAAATCGLTSETGSCGSVTWDIEPFAPGDPFGDFQSQPGTGQSLPITITFSGPVQEVSVEIQDPTFAGNQMVAYNGGTVVSTQDFAFSGQPGVNIPDTKTAVGPIDRVDLIPADGDYVAYSATITVDSAQSVNVVCTPATLVRGATVRCVARLAVPQAFTVTERSARDSSLMFTVQDTTQLALVAGDSAVWEGEAVATSDVTFSVEIVDGTDTVRLTNPPARFTVTPRAWPGWSYQTPTTFQFRWVWLVQPGMKAYPDERDTSTIGNFQALPPPTGGLPITRPASGPNRDVGFVTEPYIVMDYFIAVHPGLDLGAYSPSSPGFVGAQQWVNDQNGIPSGTCVQDSIPILLAAVERHEGIQVVSNSHPGVGNGVFAQTNPHLRIERVYGATSDSVLRVLLGTLVDSVLYDSAGAYQVAQRQFDAADTPVVLGSAGCPFDFNPRNP